MASAEEKVSVWGKEKGKECTLGVGMGGAAEGCLSREAGMD